MNPASRSALLAASIVAPWLVGRLLGTNHWAGLALAALAAAGALVWLTRTREPAPRSQRPWTPRYLLVAGLLGVLLAGAALQLGWTLGGDTGANWALRHGLQLGWWTDQLPFLPGKALALVLAGVLGVLLVVPDELVLRGITLHHTSSWPVARIYAAQLLLALLASTGDLWLRPAPAAAWAIHLLVAATLAAAATWVARRSGSLLPALLLHATVRALLVVHAFAFIPRLYR